MDFKFENVDENFRSEIKDFVEKENSAKDADKSKNSAIEDE